MPNDDRPEAVPPLKGPAFRPGVWLVLGLVLVAILILVVFVTRDDDGAAATSTSGVIALPPSSSTANKVDTKDVIVSRLREILAARGEAYRERDPTPLKRIYTVDCPCLKSDSNAIHELIKKNYFWVGGETSITVRRTERVTARLWIVVAEFHSASLRIETESGQLVRKEPSGQDLFQFALARPTGSTQWLLGRASSYEDS
jgi:hypothetical protein